MKSELKTTLRGLTAAFGILLAGCGGGGSSNGGGELAAPTPPGNPDESLIEDYPAIDHFYFQGDDYNGIANEQAPRIRTYQAGSTSGSNVTEVDYPTAQLILRPKVALSSRSMTFAYGVLVTDSEFWYLAPDESTIRRLSTLTGKICQGGSKTYSHGIARANAGIMTRLAGADGLCATGDDEYWAIPLTTTANEPAQAINAAVYHGTPLLDGTMKHLGFLHADADQPLELYDTQGNLLQTLLGTVAGPVQPLQYMAGSRAILVVGNSLYLIDTVEMIQPGYSLPAPVYTAVSPTLDAGQIRFDADRFYVTDGNRLVGISDDGAIAFDQTLADYTKLTFESSSVFTANYILLYAADGSDEDLIAIPKDASGTFTQVEADPVPRREPGLQGPLCFATSSYVYFSKEVLPADVATPALDADLQAGIWHDSGSSLASYSRYDAARWYFYENLKENGISDQALLLQSKPRTSPGDTTPRVTSSGYFENPLLFIYYPENPDPADQTDPSASTRNLKFGSISAEAPARIRELGSAQNGHLLMTLESAAADPINMTYLTPNANMRRLTTKSAVCERLLANDSSTTELCRKE